MPSLIPLDDNSQRSLSGGVSQPAKRLIPIQDSSAPAAPPAAPAPAKRLGKTRAVSWLGEANLPVVGQYAHPGGLRSDVVSYPAPTKENPGARILLATPAPGPGGGKRTSDIGVPQVVEQAPDGTFRKVGSYKPAAAPEQQVAPAQSTALEQPRISDLMRNRETVEQWKSRRPKEVAELERDYTTYSELKDRNPILALQFKQSAEEKYAKLQAELGSPDQFISQQRQVEMGMLTPPQLVMQGADGRTASIQSLRGSDTQGAQASELGAGVGEQAAQYDDAAARVAYQRGFAPDNAAGRVLQSFGTGVESVAAGAARLLPEELIGNATLDEVSRNQTALAQAAADKSGGVGRALQGISQSYGVVAPGAALGAVTGGAATGMALTAGLSQYGQAYQQATDAGLRGADREQFATINAAAESLMSLAFTKLLKMPGLEGAFAKAGIGAETAKGVLLKAAKQVGMSGLEELPEEVLTQIAQNVNTRMSGVDAAKKILTGDELFDIAVQSFGAAGGARALGVLPSVPGEISKANVIRGNAKAYVETPTGPADWAKSHPMAAEEIAAAVQEGKPISRAMMEANSLPTMDSVKRNEWAAKVQSAVVDLKAKGVVDEASGEIAVQDKAAAEAKAAEEAAKKPLKSMKKKPVSEQPVQVPEPAATQPSAIFKTSQGSEYQLHDDGTTTRNKSLHAGHDKNDTGQKRRSDATFFVSPDGAREVGMWQTSSATGKRIAIEGDTAVLLSNNPKTGQPGIDGRIKLSQSPEVGMHPLEVWDKNDKGWYRSNHPGNAITEINNAASPNVAEPTSTEPAAPAQPQAEIPQAQQAEVGEPAPAPSRRVEVAEVDDGHVVTVIDDDYTPSLYHFPGKDSLSRAEAFADRMRGGEGQVSDAEWTPDRQPTNANAEQAPAPTRSLKNPDMNPDIVSGLGQAKPALTRGQQIRTIQQAYPGAEVKPDLRQEGRYTVTLPNGKFITAEFTPQIEGASRTAMRRSLEAAYPGRTITEADIDNASVTGRWRVSDGQGFELDGQGIVKILDSLDEKTATAKQKHEALHAARSMGLITDAEWNALVQRYAPNAKTEGAAEEKIAGAAEAWSGPDGLLAKLKQLFNQFMAAITGDRWKPNADTAMKRVQSGKVLKRLGKTESREAASARLSAELGGDVRYSAEFDEDWMKDDAKSYNRLADLQDKLRKVTNSIERLPPVSELLKSNPRRSDESLQDWRNRMLREIPQTPGQMRDELAILSEMVPLLKERVAYSKKWHDKSREEFGKDNKDSTRLRREEIEAEKAVDEIISRGSELRRLLKEQDDSDISYAAAFHGSPHTFDKFTTAKMGTGEGAQAYGWGLYFAGKKAVAEHYRDQLSGDNIEARNFTQDGKVIASMSDMLHQAATEVAKTTGNYDRAVRVVAEVVDSVRGNNSTTKNFLKRFQVAAGREGEYEAAINALGDIRYKKNKGRLYHVDLKPAEDEYLLWDKPLSEQSEKVRKALHGININPKSRGDEIYGRFVDDAVGGEDAPVNLPDSQWKLAMADAKRAASEKLKSLGIRGIKYLDGTSRSQGEGSHNYVIFDDADVDITAMYSAELAGAEDGSAKDKAAAAKAWREQGTESPWFKRWFGGSKVVDAEEKPLRVFHGTRSEDFSVFKNPFNPGEYFSDDPAMPNALANNVDGSRVYPAYIKIEKPLDLRSLGKDASGIKMSEFLESQGLEYPKNAVNSYTQSTFSHVNDLRRDRQWMKAFKRAGYDGIVFADTHVTDGSTKNSFVVFDSNQIKSSTANTGEFSPDNADIRYSAGPTQAQKERTASLANPGMSPDVRNQIDAERLQMDSPETQPLAEVQRLADAITPDQARAALASGKPVTAPEMEAARRLKESVTRNALVNRTAANLAESAKVIAQYDLIGTESARAFNIRRDRVETPFQRNQRLLGDELIGAPKSIRDAIKDALRLANEALLKGDKKTAKVERDRATKLSREGARMAEKNRAFLERIGLLPKDGDEAAWNEIFGNDIKSFRLLREASALNQGYGSAIMEYWNSLLLSGPATQARNLLGTPLNYSIEAFIERPILAAARVAIGKQSAGDTLRAAKEWWKGFSLAGAWRHAVDSYMQETSTFDRLFKGDDYGGLLENMDGYYSIRGLKGRVIRGLGWGPLRAADQFWKALIGGMEVGRFAYAQARSELGANAKSEDISNRMAEIMADYHSDAWEKASARSDIATFTEKGSETRHQVKQRVKALRNVVPGAKFIIPFIDTPVNIAAQTIERAPALGALRYAFKMRDNIKNKRPTFDGLGEAAVKQLVSTAALTALLQSGLMSDDDDKYFAIRSGQHADPLKRYTFKWGDTDLSYQGLEPVASLLSLMADWNASQRSGVNPGTVVVGSTIDQIANKPMLQGLGDILQIMNPRDYGTADSKWKTMEANGLNYAKNFGASWVPAIYKQTVKALRPNALNTRIMATDAEGKDKWTLAGKRMLEQAELGWMLERAGFKDAPAAQIDVFGKPKSNVILDGDTLLSNPVTDFMYRLTSPLRTTEQNAHPANELLAAWNRTKPEGAEDYKLSAVEPRYTDDKGKAAVMDEHQFEQLQRLAGGIADKLYAKGKFDPKNPTEAQVAMLTERLLPAAKEEARKLVVDSIVTGKPVAETIDQIADRLDKKVRVSVFQAASEKVKRTLNKGEKDWQRDRRVEKSLKKRGLAQEQRDKLREGG